jgi:MbtH protein
MDCKTPESDMTYVVVRNSEERYSIWSAARQVPLGWHAISKTGSLDECLAYISEAWTDMRPLNTRESTGYLA